MSATVTPEGTFTDVGTLVFGGSGSARNITFAPVKTSVPNLYQVTVTADDGTSKVTQSMNLRVNGTPAFFPIVDIGTLAGTPIKPFKAHIYDDSNLATLTVTASSSNQAFLPDNGIQIGAAYGANASSPGHVYRDITLVPATSGAGSATVTLKIQDAEGLSSERSFDVLLISSAKNGAELVSQSSDPNPVIGDSYSLRAAVSSDGRYVAFESNAKNLDGYASYTEIFLRDRQAKTTKRITSGFGHNERPVMTPDGRYIAFYSDRALVGNDTNGVADVYVYDTKNASFERISLSSDESEANAASFPPQFDEERPGISDDGRYVVFRSSASNLIATDTNNVDDVFLRDRTLGTTVRLSVSSAGTEANGASSAPAISGDGSVVVFASLAKNLVDGVVDTDGRSDVFMRTGSTTSRISHAYGSTEAANAASDRPAVSSDGNVIAVSSAATNLGPSTDLTGKTDIWVYTRSTSAWSRVNLDLDPNGSQDYCSGPSLSSDGQRLVFSTMASRTDEVSGFVQTYAFDRGTQAFTLVSKSFLGSAPSGGTGYDSVISSSGDFVVFHTAADDIVVNDDNTSSDAFIVPLP
ncbi:MAG: hypothetical protein QM778_24580 [Myxococcales bacterium]